MKLPLSTSLSFFKIQLKQDMKRAVRLEERLERALAKCRQLAREKRFVMAQMSAGAPEQVELSPHIAKGIKGYCERRLVPPWETIMKGGKPELICLNCDLWNKKPGEPMYVKEKNGKMFCRECGRLIFDHGGDNRGGDITREDIQKGKPSSTTLTASAIRFSEQAARRNRIKELMRKLEHELIDML